MLKECCKIACPPPARCARETDASVVASAMFYRVSRRVFIPGTGAGARARRLQLAASRASDRGKA